MEDAIDDEGQHTRQPIIMLGGTMRVDGRLDKNTAFRAETLVCLIIPLIICLAKEFINHHQRIDVRQKCDNQGLVDQLRRFCKHERYHIYPDTADNDLTLPAAHWARKNDSSLLWQQGHHTLPVLELDLVLIERRCEIHFKI